MIDQEFGPVAVGKPLRDVEIDCCEFAIDRKQAPHGGMVSIVSVDSLHIFVDRHFIKDARIKSTLLYT